MARACPQYPATRERGFAVVVNNRSIAESSMPWGFLKGFGFNEVTLFSRVLLPFGMATG